MEIFINVILPIPLEKHFTYRISEYEASQLKLGMRVAVPFGKTKLYTALVVELHNRPPLVYEAKAIHDILDEQPIVTSIQLKHWQWIADYYMCTLGEVFRSAIPSALLLESETLILPNKDAIIDEDQLKDDDFLVYEALKYQNILHVNDIMEIVEKKNILPILNRLIKINAIVLKEEIHEQYKPKMVRYARLGQRYNSEVELEVLLNSLTRAPKQSQVVLSLFHLQATKKKPIKLNELEIESKSSRAVIRALINKEVLEEYFIQTDRVVFSGGKELEPPKELNEYQVKALNTIRQSFNKNKVTLLKGVTSSGKTEVYVQLIEECLSEGKQALYLVPEIAITTQLISRLQEYFGSAISVFHSKYNMQEKVEVWNNVLENK